MFAYAIYRVNLYKTVPTFRGQRKVNLQDCGSASVTAKTFPHWAVKGRKLTKIKSCVKRRFLRQKGSSFKN